MIRVFKDEKNIGIKISGHKFDELKDYLRDNNFYFKHRWNYQENLWVGSYLDAFRVLPELREIEPFDLEIDFLNSLLPKPKTIKYRIPLKEDLLKSEPIGEFQKTGIKHCISQNRFMLAWEMGLGKTYTIISAINHLWEKQLVDRVCIVAPSESIYNFKREFLRFNSFDLKEEDFYIANVKNRKPFDSEAKVVIMTYRTFLMLSDEAYQKRYKKKSKNYRKPTLRIDNWGTSRAIILDESHSIKSMRARQTKVLHLHKDYFQFRYLLTGTPDPNGVEGFYSQISFLDEGVIGEGFNSWLSSVANIGNQWSAYGVNYFYPDKVKEFVDKISPWVSREFTENNIELPELYVKKIYTELSDEQLDIYKELTSYTLSVIKEEHGEIIPKIVENKFAFIMQALDNPSLLKGKIDQDISFSLYKKVEKWKFKNHSKLEVCSSLIDKYIEEGKKVILWSYHPLTMDQLAEHYKKYNPIVIHGQIPLPKDIGRDQYKNELLEKFKKEKNKKLLIASSIMLSSAVNIVEASRGIDFDRPLNPVYWMQGLKRNHRYGATERVIRNPLIFSNTLEERMDRLLERKENMNNNLMNADSLSSKEWKKLFLGEIVLE